MTRDFRVHGHAMLQQEGADLITGTLTDPSFTHAVKRGYERDDLVTAVDDDDDVCAGSCVITIGRPHGRARLLT